MHTNLYIDWENDGVWDVLGITSSGVITPPYPSDGDYQIAIRGVFPAITLGKWNCTKFSCNSSLLHN